MDKLANYRRILQEIILQQAKYKPADAQIEPLAICDTNHDQYLLVDVGWNKARRVHDIIIHMQLKDGKIWIEG